MNNQMINDLLASADGKIGQTIEGANKKVITSDASSVWAGIGHCTAAVQAGEAERSHATATASTFTSMAQRHCPRSWPRCVVHSRSCTSQGGR